MAQPSDHQHLTLRFWLKALQVRARFFVFVAALAGMFALWPFLSAAWDRWLSKWSKPDSEMAVGSGSEFFCPMDPGVISAWPAICPICNMDLIRRQTGDALFLPEGVVARMQLSPYKLTLAGIRTVEIESYVGGNSSALPSHPGQPSLDQQGDIPGAQAAISKPEQPNTVRVPVSAIVYREQQPLVYVETMPGMFDALPVTMRERDANTQIVSGKLIPGQRVVAMGTLLLDAESRLKPNLSTNYFGAAQPSSLAIGPRSLPTRAATGKATSLTPEDQQLVDRQAVCPVTQATLGSMGTPVLIEVNGRRIALCCAGCRGRVLADPQKVIDYLDQRLQRTRDDGK